MTENLIRNEIINTSMNKAFAHSSSFDYKKVNNQKKYKLRHYDSVGNFNKILNKEINQIYLLCSNKKNQSRHRKSHIKSKKSSDTTLKDSKLSFKTNRSKTLINDYEEGSKSLNEIYSKKNENKDDKFDQDQFKSNLYMSYLNYGNVNPFKSNYDILNKTNPDFYKNFIKKSEHKLSRFNRVNTSYTLLNNSIDYKNVLCHIEPKLKDSFCSINDAQQINSQKLIFPSTEPDERQSSAIVLEPIDKDTYINETSTQKKDLNKQINNILDKTLINSDSNMSNKTELNGIKNTDLCQKSNLFNNQFLNYRNKRIQNDTNILKASNSNYNSIVSQSKKEEQPIALEGNKIKENSILVESKTNIFSDYRSKNGPEKFLDPFKLMYIKNWVQNVNSIQEIHGKHRETINKISFYD